MVAGQVGNTFHRAPLIAHLDRCEGKTLATLDVSGVFKRVDGHKKVTGIAGNVIEQSVLAIPANPRQEPDIVVDGVRYEVKTTGVRKKDASNEAEAKEPMSITAVSPEKIVGEKYFQSHFWNKISHMVLFYYLYDSRDVVPACKYASFPLLSYEFHEYEDFTVEERDTLKSDWQRVRNFIIFLNNNYRDSEAEYPRISHDLRSELMLLDTAPKWPNRPRFRFKRTFVTAIYRRHVEKRKRLESLPQAYTTVRDIDDKLFELTVKYRGMTVSELCSQFGIVLRNTVPKSVAEPVVVKMFGGTKSKMRDVELFAKIGLVGKSMVLTRDGRRTEDMKFFTIDFEEFATDGMTFEESQFYDYFASSKFLFVLFEEPSAAAPLSDNKFVGFDLVTFDGDFIENHVRPVWERIRKLVISRELRDETVVDKYGCPIRNRNGQIRTRTNLPKSCEGIVFVRGTGTDSTDKPINVNGIPMYRQQVWVKGSYLADVIWRRKASR